MCYIYLVQILDRDPCGRTQLNIFHMHLLKKKIKHTKKQLKNSPCDEEK